MPSTEMPPTVPSSSLARTVPRLCLPPRQSDLSIHQATKHRTRAHRETEMRFIQYWIERALMETPESLEARNKEHLDKARPYSTPTIRPFPVYSAPTNSLVSQDIPFRRSTLAPSA